MRTSARQAASLVLLLIAFAAAAWGLGRAIAIGAEMSAAGPGLLSSVERGLASDTTHVCIYDPAAFGEMLTSDEVRAWRIAMPGAVDGTLDLPMASLWTLFGSIGLAAMGHGLAIGGLSVLNPYFVAISWWALLPEMFLANGGWFGELSPGYLWSALAGIGLGARLQPWGRRSSARAEGEAPATRLRLLNKKTVVAGGVCWLTAFGVFAAVYPNLSSNVSIADAAPQSAPDPVRQERGQGDYVGEQMDDAGAGDASEQAPEFAEAPPVLPPAPAGDTAPAATAESEGGGSDSSLPRFDGPSFAANGGPRTQGGSTGGQPTTAPTTPTVEMALAESAPSPQALSSPWMQAALMEMGPGRQSTPSEPSSPSGDGETAQQPQGEKPEVSLPDSPVPPIDVRGPIVDLPTDPAKPDTTTPPPPSQEPTGPRSTEPPPGPGQTPIDEVVVPPIQVPEPAMLGLFALGLVGIARLRRRG